MRKTITRILLLILAAFVLAGCSKDNPENTDPTETTPGGDTENRWC